MSSAASTDWRVAPETPGRPLSTRETVAVLTCACCAMSASRVCTRRAYESAVPEPGASPQRGRPSRGGARYRRLMPTSFPTDPAAWPAFLSTTVDASLDDARALLARLKDGTPRSTTEVLGLWNDADIAIATGSAAAHLLAEVHPDADLRAAAEERAQAAEDLVTERGLDHELWQVLAATDAGGSRCGCGPAARARAARLPPRGRRPLAGGPRPPEGARPAVHRAGPGVLPQHPRRRPQHPGAARAAGRAARRLPRGAPGGRGRAGHADHRVPGPAAGPHVRDRPVGPAGAHHASTSASAGRPTSRSWRSCSGCVPSGRRCWATRTGRRTTPRTR